MPGRLTNEDGTGRVELSERIQDIKTQSITRDDVASVIAKVLDAENTIGKSLDLLQGDTEVEKAVNQI